MSERMQGKGEKEGVRKEKNSRGGRKGKVKSKIRDLSRGTKDQEKHAGTKKWPNFTLQ